MQLPTSRQESTDIHKNFGQVWQALSRQTVLVFSTLCPGPIRHHFGYLPAVSNLKGRTCGIPLDVQRNCKVAVDFLFLDNVLYFRSGQDL